MSGIQAVQATGNLIADGGEPSPLDFPGMMPEGTVDYSAGVMVSATWDNVDFPLVEETIEASEAVPVDVDFSLIGLQGTVTFSK